MQVFVTRRVSEVSTEFLADASGYELSQNQTLTCPASPARWLDTCRIGREPCARWRGDPVLILPPAPSLQAESSTEAPKGQLLPNHRCSALIGKWPLGRGIFETTGKRPGRKLPIGDDDGQFARPAIANSFLDQMCPF